MLVGFKPYLQDQLVSFSALTLLVWSYDLYKIVPDMTYNVFGGTLNLAQSINPLESLSFRTAEPLMRFCDFGPVY